MRIEKRLIELGYDKNGELDFGVNCSVGDLTLDQMKELREMIVVTIWVAEDMWRRNQEKKRDDKAVGG